VYSMPLWAMCTVLRPRSKASLGTGGCAAEVVFADAVPLPELCCGVEKDLSLTISAKI
jgi:hypothetical protein